MVTLYELKRITGASAVEVLMECTDPDYLERRAAHLRTRETDPATEYRVIARY